MWIYFHFGAIKCFLCLLCFCFFYNNVSNVICELNFLKKINMTFQYFILKAMNAFILQCKVFFLVTSTYFVHFAFTFRCPMNVNVVVLCMC